MMKAYYAETMADLKAQSERITALIAELERYGDEMNLTAPVPPVQSPQPPAASAGTPTAARRRVSSQLEAEKVSPLILVRDAIANLEEPFTVAEAKAWCAQHRKAYVSKVGKSSWFTSIYGLKNRGEIAEHPPGKNGKCAYVRTAGFGGHTPKEVEYRKLRSEMAIKQPTD